MNEIKTVDFDKSGFCQKDLADFFEKNDKDFPDPFSAHVDLGQYAEKLINLAHVVLAVDGRSIAGVAAAYENDLRAKTAHLQYLCVNANYRRGGLAKKLLSKVQKTAAEQGMEKIILSIDKANASAENLYRSQGFSDYPVLRENPRKKYMFKFLDEGMRDLSVKETQNALAEIANETIKILTRHEIPYMITFGTLLGAVRHKDFIPWDDDFDLFLFSDSYDKALKVLEEELPERFFVEYFHNEPLYFHAYAHVKDKNTLCYCSQYPQDGIYSNNGLSVDLYRLTEMTEGELEAFLIEEKIKFNERKCNAGLILKEQCEKTVNELKADLRFSPPKKGGDKIFAMPLKQRMVYKNDVFPLKKYKFGQYEFLGPDNAHKILTEFYGDYMKLPEEKDRVPHYSCVKSRI